MVEEKSVWEAATRHGALSTVVRVTLPAVSDPVSIFSTMKETSFELGGEAQHWREHRIFARSLSVLEIS